MSHAETRISCITARDDGFMLLPSLSVRLHKLNTPSITTHNESSFYMVESLTGQQSLKHCGVGLCR